MVLFLPKFTVSDCTRVRIDSQYSDWVYITAGMPQGSPPGLLSFLLLIDATLTELLPRGSHKTHM